MPICLASLPILPGSAAGAAALNLSCTYLLMSCDFLNDKCNMFVALHFAGKDILS